MYIHSYVATVLYVIATYVYVYGPTMKSLPCIEMHKIPQSYEIAILLGICDIL